MARMRERIRVVIARVGSWGMRPVRRRVRVKMDVRVKVKIMNITVAPEDEEDGAVGWDDEHIPVLLDGIPAATIRHVFWDTVPCGAVDDLMESLGHVRASAEVFEHEHDEANSRIRTVPPDCAEAIDHVARVITALNISGMKQPVPTQAVDQMHGAFARTAWAVLALLTDSGQVEYTGAGVSD